MMTRFFWNVAWLGFVLVTAYLLVESLLPRILQVLPADQYPAAGFILRVMGIACCIGWYCWAREEKPPAEL